MISWAFGPPPRRARRLDRHGPRSKVHLVTQLSDEKDFHWLSVEKSEEMRQYIYAYQAWRQPSDKFPSIEKPLWGSLAGEPHRYRPP